MSYNARLTEVQKQQLCDRYSAGEGATCLAKVYGIDATSVNRMLRRRGVPVGAHPAKKLSVAQEKELCRRYEAGEGTTLLSRRFGVSAATARKTLLRHGVAIRAKKQPLSKERRGEIVARYQKGEGGRILGAAYGIAPGSVVEIVRSGGVDVRAKKGEPLTPRRKNEICRLYVAGQGSSALAQKFDVSKASVLRLLEKRKVKMRSVAEASNIKATKYQCDHSFFDEINTEEKAYWLGFITADGNVYKRVLSVGLSDSDEDHLYRLKEALNSTHLVRRWPRPASVINGRACAASVCSMFSINSLQIVNALKDLGVTEKKSLIATWAGIPLHLERHYLRGLVDGDGCFCSTSRGQMQFYLCGSRGITRAAKQVLRLNCDLNETKTLEKEEFHTICFAGNKQVSRIAEYLYDGATVFLPRKYEKVKHLIGRYK